MGSNSSGNDWFCLRRRRLADLAGGFGGLSEGVEVRHFFDIKQGDSLNRSNLGFGVVIVSMCVW